MDLACGAATGCHLSGTQHQKAREVSQLSTLDDKVSRGDERGLVQRLVRLYTGLLLYGGSAGLMVLAGLGLGPWDVFHQGLSRLTGYSIGVVAIVVGALVLLLWWPLRQRPGLGTASNVVVVGAAIDATLWLVPEPRGLAVRIPLLLFAIVLNGLATGLYISGRFGTGPRDGLMTGLHQLTGRSIRLVRTGIEVTVLASGVLLGGSAGVGTVLYALGIGPLAQIFLRLFAPRTAPAASPTTDGPTPAPGPHSPSTRGRSRIVAWGGRRRSTPRAERH